MRRDPNQDTRTSVRDRIRPVFKSLVLVGVTTVGLLVLDHFFALRHVTLVYLVPVVIAATKLGIVPAVIAAIAGAGASAFFFYPPIYSFLVRDPNISLNSRSSCSSPSLPAIWRPISGGRPILRGVMKPKCRIFTRSRAGSPLPIP